MSVTFCYTTPTLFPYSFIRCVVKLSSCLLFGPLCKVIPILYGSHRSAMTRASHPILPHVPAPSRKDLSETTQCKDLKEVKII